MNKLEVKIWILMAAVCGALGGACLTWAPIRFGAVFLGALATGCAGEAIMVARAEESAACRRVAVLGRVLFGLFLASFVAIQGLILSGERTDDAVYAADYVLVLGAHIYDDRPSAALQSRLDVAARLLEDNPDARLVLCGGQGPDEIMPEAHMMRDYLLAGACRKTGCSWRTSRTTPSRTLRTPRRSLTSPGRKPRSSRTNSTLPVPGG